MYKITTTTLLFFSYGQYQPYKFWNGKAIVSCNTLTKFLHEFQLSSRSLVEFHVETVRIRCQVYSADRLILICNISHYDRRLLQIFYEVLLVLDLKCVGLPAGITPTLSVCRCLGCKCSFRGMNVVDEDVRLLFMIPKLIFSNQQVLDIASQATFKKFFFYLFIINAFYRL